MQGLTIDMAIRQGGRGHPLVRGLYGTELIARCPLLTQTSRRLEPYHYLKRPCRDLSKEVSLSSTTIVPEYSCRHVRNSGGSSWVAEEGEKQDMGLFSIMQVVHSSASNQANSGIANGVDDAHKSREEHCSRFVEIDFYGTHM